MSSQNHIIRRQTFDITYTSRQKSFELQNRFSRLFNDSLMPLTEEIFERIVPANFVISWQEVVIDLGDILQDDLEEQIIEKYKEALEKEIRYRLSLMDNKPDSETASGADANKNDLYLRLLKYFLVSGTMPWWASHELSTDINQVFSILVLHAPDALKAMLLETGKFDYVRQRLAYQLAEDTIQKVISVLEPEQAVFIFQYHTDLVHVQEKDRLVPGSIYDFKRIAWLAIIQYLLVQHSGYFNRKMFVKNTLQHLSAHFNADYFAVLHLFSKAIKDDNAQYRFKSTLPALIRDLEMEYNFEQRASVRDIKDSGHSINYIHRQVELVKYFLIFGTMPYWAKALSNFELNDIFQSLAIDFPETLRLLVNESGKQEAVRQRIVKTFNDEVIHNLIHALEPQHAGFIISYAKDIGEINRQKNLLKTDAENFRVSKWEFILSYLLVDKSSRFEKKMFMISIITQMAARYNVGLRELIHFFVQAIAEEQAQNRQYASLSQLLIEIYNDEVKTNSDAKPNEIQGYANGDAEIYTPENEYFISLAKASSSHAEIWVKIRALLLRYDTDGAIYHAIINANKSIELLLFFLSKSPLHTMANDNSLRQMLNNSRVGDNLFTTLMLPERQILDIMKAGFLQVIKQHEAKFKPGEAASKSGLDRTFEHEMFDILGISASSIYQETNIAHIAIRDVLRHFFQYGHLPWWAAEYATEAPEALLEKLYKGNANEAIHLMQFLALKEPVRRRMVLQLSTGNIMKTLFPDKKAELEALFKSFIYSVQKTTRRYKAGFQLQESTILLILIRNGSRHSFLNIDHELFITHSIQYLSAETGLGAKLFYQEILADINKNESGWPNISAKIITALKKAPEAASEHAFTKAIKSKQVAKEWFQDWINNYLAAENSGKESFAGWLRHVQQEAAPKPDTLPPTDEMVTTKVASVVAYFLANNNLPAEFITKKDIKLQVLLKEMMIYLYEKDASLLHKLMRQMPQSAQAHLFMHDLFARASTMVQAGIHALLEEYVQADMVIYLGSFKALPTDLKTIETEPRLLWDAIRSMDNASARKFLIRSLKLPSMAKWVAGTYNEDEIFKLIDNLNLGWGTATTAFLKSLRKLLLHSSTDTLGRDKLLAIFNSFTMQAMGGKLNINGPEEYIRQFVSFLSKQQNSVGTNLFEGLLTAMEKSSFKKDVHLTKVLPVMRQHILTVNSTLKLKQEAETNIQNQDTKVLETILANEAGAQKKAELDAIKADLEKKQAAQKKALKEELHQFEDDIFIQNAGLVLLWPFFGYYFNKLGLVEEGKFIDFNAAARAVHLLEYLVYGTEKNPEQKLVLNKILCNIDILEPVPEGIHLSQEETELSHELLKTATQQWDKLKNTSMEGFQTSFLQREGLISAVDDGWRLRVEQRGYDVLLQTLPWSLNMIKTSWMDKMLYVEWT